MTAATRSVDMSAVSVPTTREQARAGASILSASPKGVKRNTKGLQPRKPANRNRRDGDNCVWMGRTLTADEAADLLGLGITAVLDLTAEFDEPPPLRELAYFNLPILDLTAPTGAQLAHAVAFLEEQTKRGPVYIHCKIGYS